MSCSRGERLRHSGAALVAVGVVLFATLYAAGPTSATHVTPNAEGEIAWCNFRVTNITPGASFSWWYRCTTVTGKQFYSGGDAAKRPDMSVRRTYGFTTPFNQNENECQLGTTGVVPTINANTAQATGTGTWCNHFGGNTIVLFAAEPITTAPNYNGGLFVNDSELTDGTRVAAYNATTDHELDIENIDVGTGFPSFPLEGGTPAVQNPTSTCHVDLSTGDGTNRARFTAAVTNSQAPTYTDTYSWALGDSATSTQLSPTHNYATGDNAGAEWHAVLTITRNGTATGTCVIDFDFFGPSRVYGDGTTPDPDDPPDDETDEDEEGGCSLWPHKFIVCWLKKLFVPDGNEITSTWDELVTSAEENWPLGPADWAVDTLTGVPAALDQEADPEYYNCGPNGCAFHVGIPVGDEVVEVAMIEGGTAEGQWYGPLREVAWWGSTVCFTILLVTALLGTARSVMSRDGDGD